MSHQDSSVRGPVRSSLLALVLIAALFAASCGSSAPLAISLVSSAGTSLAAGQSTTITATVAHDSTGKGVMWSLSPSSGAGALSGATATSVTYTAPATIPSATTVTITATSVANSTKSVTFTINLLPISIALAPATAQTLEHGQNTTPSPITATVSNDPANKGVTWSLTGAGALSGQTATTVVYTAPASIAAASTATVTATSVADTTKSTPLTINLVPPPSITSTSASLPAGTVGTVYTTTNLAATGGVSPYTWTVTTAASTFPAGLTLSSAGAISGTPTAFGTFNFTVQVKDANNFTATAALSIKINPAPLVVTTTSLPNGIVNTPGYSATLTSTGGATPITWSWAAQAGSTLPNGLTLAPTGTISGTPTAAGTFNVTVTATDSSAPALTASKNLTVTIIPQLVISTSSPLPNGITNTAYTGVTLASTGGSGAVVWTLTGGTTLPANLSLNASTGAITGTPTTAGTFTFTVQAADSGTPQQKVTKAFTITIIQQLVITTPAALPTGSVTTPYSVTMASSGGTGAVTWAQTGGTLPGGLTLTTAGVLAGTPTTANTFNFSITATDSGVPAQTATVAFTVTITPKLAVNTTSLPSGIVGTAYSQTLQTNGGGIAPITWSVTAGALPLGLSLAPGTGVISGTPTSATGSPFSFTVQAADSSTPKQTATQALSISIATAPLSVATTGLPNGVVGQAYTGAMLQSAGGNPPVTWTIVAPSVLPTWASLNASSGAITGTPNAAGTTTFTVKATDSSTPVQTATKQLSITVVAALSITTTQSQIPAGIVGQSYSAPVTATGGTTPYAWSWAAQALSSLPPGLGIDPASGTISGTPNSAGTFNVTVTVMDSTSPQQTATANFSITVTVAPLMVTTTSNSLPTGTINTVYPNTNLSASGGIQPYTWAVTGGALPLGLMLSTSGTISGTPTATGTAAFTVTVTDSATPAHTANANLSITVSAAAACGPALGNSEAFLNGSYAFLLKGFDSSGNPALVGGVLTFNGSGGITAGAMDMNLNSGVQTNLSVTSASSSYRVTSDQRGCMVITTSAGTQNYRFSLGNIAGGVASTGHVINFDTTGPFTAGVLRKQSSGSFTAATVTGSYAFGASSIQNANVVSGGVAGGRFGVVGELSFNGSGVVTGGSEDFNQNGTLDGSAANTNWPASPITISGGTYTVSSNGRGTLAITVTGVAGTFHDVLYVVSSSEALFMTSDPQTTNTILAGQALLQSGTPFSANPLSGAYVGYQSGLNPTNGTGPVSRTTLLLLTASGNSITGNQLRNDGGSFQSKSIGAGITYSVASSGRMIVSGGGGGGGPIFYLVSPNQAFAVGTGNTVDTGFFQSQTGGPFTNASATGTYAFGTIEPVLANSSENLGAATFTPATTTINVIDDQNGSGGQNLDQTQTFNYSIDSTGLGMIPASGSSCTISATSTTCQTVFYIISPTKAVIMDTQSSNPKIQLGDK